LLKEWGFKRCEDIIWVKTNEIRKKAPVQSEEGILIRVKEHCLMGYKGDSKKASDHKFIHPNIDIDVVIT
jgi:N6-adenosine-specific RNA methylase IME4